MNHIYRLIWNEVTQTWVAMAEIRKAGGKSSAGTVGHALQLKSHALSLLAAALALCAVPAWALDVNALPTGGSVAAGSASISQSANVLTVQQSSARAALDWQSFNIGASATVNFQQPTSNSVALNRITGNDASQIYGKLNANGQVFFTNPSGMLFAPNSQVNVGGLLASTLKLGVDDFMAGHYRLSQAGAGAIRTEGAIQATGSVVLLGNTVQNTGQIFATTVTLAAGNTVALDLTGDGLIRARVEDAALKASIENSGRIDATAAVTLSAGQVKNALDRVVNNSGVIKATGLSMQGGDIVLEGASVTNSGRIDASGAQGGGRIELMGDMSAGSVFVGGTLDASAPVFGNGGFIETSAAHVNIADSAQVTTSGAAGVAGNWLIDPFDFTIAASGGNMTGAVLSSSLAAGNVIIESFSGGAGTAGDIHVNDIVSWSANQLTLTAAHDININAVMTASGASSLVLNTSTANGGDSAVSGGLVRTGFDGGGSFKGRVDFPERSGTGFLTINGNGYTVLSSLGVDGDASGATLQGMNASPGGFFALGSNIDASSTAGWDGGLGFLPTGQEIGFSGVFNGLGHTINSLIVNRPNENSAGLFSFVGGQGSIANLGLLNATVNGAGSVGALVGWNQGTISNSYATGSVSGTSEVGGLVGGNWGTISNSYATGSVSGTSTNFQAFIGGLVGDNYGAISNSHASGSVTGSGNNPWVGGLAGENDGSISNSYATGDVSGNGAGGLVAASGGSIVNSYATGSVAGGWATGGLVGEGWGTIRNSYATGIVTGITSAGGLVGDNFGAIINSYATGNVTGSDFGEVGGLVGANIGGTIDNSFATGNVDGVNGYMIGGLAGFSDGTISNSYATGSVSGAGDIGGLVGYSDAPISNSYATGIVHGTDRSVGGLVGSNHDAISSSYASGSVSGLGDVGGLVGFNRWEISSSYWSSDANASDMAGIGLDNNNQGAGALGLTTDQMQTASSFAGFNFTNTPGAGGNNWVIVNADGTLQANGSAAVGATKPMLASEYASTITNAHQLQLMAMAPAANYTLGADVNASATSSGNDVWGSTGFVPVGNSASPFVGTFDGMGQTIAGLTINLPAQPFVGMFGMTGPSAMIQNVGLLDASVIGGSAVGLLVGYNDGTVSNSFATGRVDGSEGMYVGGLIGISYLGSVSGSHAIATVTGSWAVGGLVGEMHGTSVDNSYSSGVVNGDVHTGGLVGSAERAGGIASRITNSHSYATVYGGTDGVGGLIGSWGEGAVINSHSTGSVTGAGKRVGGLIGNNYGDIFNSFSTGHVTGLESVGGLVGFSDGTISNSYATGGASGTNGVGGLVGYSANTISDSYATGNVSGTDLVGGLVGYSWGTISNSYATGGVSGDWGVGGLVGDNSYGGTISNSYATGSVSGGDYVGGLVGVNNPGGTISNSYATGGVSGTYMVGGLMGYNGGGTISNSHYNIDLVAINGKTSEYVTEGGIYGAQYANWLSNGLTLNIANYATTLPGGNNIFSIVGVQGMKDLLGFLDNPAYAFTLAGNVDFVSVPGLYIPRLLGSFDGSGYTISNLSINQSFNENLGLFGVVGDQGSVANLGLLNATVIGGEAVGALVGRNQGTISNSYATGSVSGDWGGGLVGFSDGTISNSYATGSVSGTDAVGGLVGVNVGTISNSYATGSVSGTNAVGGLVGGGSGYGGTISSYWDRDTSGIDISSGGIGLTSSEMMQFASFSSWDMSNSGGSKAAWRIYEGHTAPLLASFLQELTLADVSVTYNGAAQSGVGYGVNNVFGSTAIGTNVGTYTNNYYSNQQGYDITGGSLTIDPLGVVISGTKVYDGRTTLATGQVGIGNVVSGDVVSLSAGTADTSSKNVGTWDFNAFNGLALTGASAGNYTLMGVSGQGTISAAPLTLSTTAVSKTYDGGLSAIGSALVASGTLFGSDRLSGGSFAYLDKNVGSGKTVSVSGVSLSDGNRGANYAVTYQDNTASSITQLASVAYIGAGGNWSDAASWAGGAIPDGANVAAVTIPTGVNVTYDGSTLGATTLSTINSGANFNFASGTLTLNGASTLSNLSMSGGALTGSGSLNVTSRFSQPGGTIQMTGPVFITQSSGDLNVGAMNASAILLAAPGGSIVQNAGVKTDSLSTSALNGITLNDAGNRVSAFNAQSISTGDIEFTNERELEIQGLNAANGSITVVNTGGIRTTGAITAPGGTVSVTANSPLTIGASGISAFGDIGLSATNLTSAGNMTLDGAINSSAGAINMSAANNFVQNSAITAALGVTANAGGSMTFGTSATTVGNPVLYALNGTRMAPPPTTLIAAPPPNPTVTPSPVIVVNQPTSGSQLAMQSNPFPVGDANESVLLESPVTANWVPDAVSDQPEVPVLARRQTMQTIIVGTSTLQRLPEEMVQLVRTSGNQLICRRG